MDWSLDWIGTLTQILWFVVSVPIIGLLLVGCCAGVRITGRTVWVMVRKARTVRKSDKEPSLLQEVEGEVDTGLQTEIDKARAKARFVEWTQRRRERDQEIALATTKAQAMMRYPSNDAPTSGWGRGPSAYMVEQIVQDERGDGVSYLLKVRIDGTTYELRVRPEQYAEIKAQGEAGTLNWGKLLGLGDGESEPTPSEPAPTIDLINGVSIARLRSLAARWVPGNRQSIGASGGTVNMGEVTELAEAVVPLLDRLEVERKSRAATKDALATDVLQEEVQRLKRQVKAQAQTIDEYATTIRELQANGPSTRDARFRAQVDVEELEKGGPVTPPNNLHEDMREALRQLAAENVPAKGKEIEIREVALLILAVPTLLDEIDRLDEIITGTMVCLPCHNPEHVETHRLGDMCEDQLITMGIRLIQALNLPPQMLPRALHEDAYCRICRDDDDGGMDYWLATGMLRPDEPTQTMSKRAKSKTKPRQRRKPDLQPWTGVEEEIGLDEMPF